MQTRILPHQTSTSKWRIPKRKQSVQVLIDCEFKPVYGSICPPKCFRCVPCFRKHTCNHFNCASSNLQSKLTTPRDSISSYPQLRITKGQFCNRRKDCQEIRDLLHLYSFDLENILPRRLMSSCRIVRQNNERKKLCKRSFPICPIQTLCDAIYNCSKPKPSGNKIKSSTQELQQESVKSCQNALPNICSATQCLHISSSESPNCSFDPCKLQTRPSTFCKKQCGPETTCKTSIEKLDTPACMPTSEIPDFDCLSSMYENISQGNIFFGNHFPDCTCEMCKKRKARTQTNAFANGSDLNLEKHNERSNQRFDYSPKNRVLAKFQSVDEILRIKREVGEEDTCSNSQKLDGNHFENCSCALCRRRLHGGCISQKITDPKRQNCRSLWFKKTATSTEDSDKPSLRDMLFSLRRQLGDGIACTGESDCPCPICCKRRVHAHIKPYSWYANSLQKPNCGKSDNQNSSSASFKNTVEKHKLLSDNTRDQIRTRSSYKKHESGGAHNTLPSSDTFDPDQAIKVLHNSELAPRENTIPDLDISTKMEQSRSQAFHNRRNSPKRDNRARLRLIGEINGESDSESYEIINEQIQNGTNPKVHRSEHSHVSEDTSDDPLYHNLQAATSKSGRRPFGLGVTERYSMMHSHCSCKSSPSRRNKKAEYCQDIIQERQLPEYVSKSIKISSESCTKTPSSTQKRLPVSDQLCCRSCSTGSVGTSEQGIAEYCRPEIYSSPTANPTSDNKAKPKVCVAKPKTARLTKSKNETPALLKPMKQDVSTTTSDADPDLEVYSITTYKSAFPPPPLEAYTTNVIREDENECTNSPYTQHFPCHCCHPSRLQYHKQLDSTGFFTQLQNRINDSKDSKIHKKKKLEKPKAKKIPLHIELYEQSKHLPGRMCCEICTT